MLVLTRKANEAVIVGGSVAFERLLKVIVLKIKGDKVQLGFEIDSDIPVYRWEIWEKKYKEFEQDLDPDHFPKNDLTSS